MDIQMTQTGKQQARWVAHASCLQRLTRMWTNPLLLVPSLQWDDDYLVRNAVSDCYQKPLHKYKCHKLSIDMFRCTESQAWDLTVLRFDSVKSVCAYKMKSMCAYWPATIQPCYHLLFKPLKAATRGALTRPCLHKDWIQGQCTQQGCVYSTWPVTQLEHTAYTNVRNQSGQGALEIWVICD